METDVARDCAVRCHVAIGSVPCPQRPTSTSAPRGRCATVEVPCGPGLSMNVATVPPLICLCQKAATYDYFKGYGVKAGGLVLAAVS